MKIKTMIFLLYVGLITVSCSPSPQFIPTQTSTLLVATATETITPTTTQAPLKCDPSQKNSLDNTAEVDIFEANQKLLRTINLGEALEFPDKGNWRWIDRDELFYLIQAGGFTAVRIPIDFAQHARFETPYDISPAFWENVDAIVERALDCHLVVIINMHNFRAESQLGYSRKFQEQFTSIWNEIAEHYKDIPDGVLYFEPFNEPGDPDYWNVILNKAITTIRKSNPTRPIIIDVADWSQASGFQKLRLPQDINLIVSFHYYSPMEFTHQCVDFIEGAKDWCGTKWEGTSEQVARINQDFDVVKKWAEKNERPIFLGEFGSISLADQEDRVQWTRTVREAAISHRFSWGYWDLCDTNGTTFGIVRCYLQPLEFSDLQTDMMKALIP